MQKKRTGGNSENYVNKFKNLIKSLIKNGLNIGVFPIHEKWTDIGRPEDYFNIK